MTNDDPTRPQDETPAGDAETVVPRDDAEGAELLEAGLASEPSADTAMVTIADARAHFPELEVLEILGQGGMGVVYKARQRTLDRLVALKILPTDLSTDPLFAERFQREARALARLQHPHIVGVYEVGEREGLHFLLMEYVDGVNLRQLMNTNSVSPTEALAIVPQICDALHYAHAQGVVHRDIKPENVLLDRGGKVKVADFGLAKLVARGPGDMTLTGTGQVMGTLHYMAPEQYKTPNDVDHRADIFSLGVVFYEMLTGELPVGRFQKPTEGLDLDERLDEIVMRALERERDLRFQTADDVKTEVGALGESKPQAEKGPRARHAERRAGRHSGSLMREMGRTTQTVMGGPSGDNRKLHPLAFASVAMFLLSGLATYAVIAIVQSQATEPRYATTPFSLGMTVAAIGFGFTALLAAFSAWTIRPQQAAFRGTRRSALVVLLALIAGPVIINLCGQQASMVSRSKEHHEEMAANGGNSRTVVVGRPWRGPTPPVPAPMQPDATSSLGRPQFSDPLPLVTGTGTAQQRASIARAVADLWTRYYQHAWTGDSLSPTQMLVLDTDLDRLRGAAGAFAGRRGGDKNELLPLLPKERFTAPPWTLKLVQVDVDEWMQGGRAAVRTRSETAGAPVITISFAIQRAKGRWWFASGPISIESTKAEAEDGD